MKELSWEFVNEVYSNDVQVVRFCDIVKAYLYANVREIFGSSSYFNNITPKHEKWI